MKATPLYYLEAISGVSLPAVQQPSTGSPEEWPHQRHYGRGVGAGGVRMWEQAPPSAYPAAFFQKTPDPCLFHTQGSVHLKM